MARLGVESASPLMSVVMRQILRGASSLMAAALRRQKLSPAEVQVGAKIQIARGRFESSSRWRDQYVQHALQGLAVAQHRTRHHWSRAAGVALESLDDQLIDALLAWYQAEFSTRPKVDEVSFLACLHLIGMSSARPTIVSCLLQSGMLEQTSRLDLLVRSKCVALVGPTELSDDQRARAHDADVVVRLKPLAALTGDISDGLRTDVAYVRPRDLDHLEHMRTYRAAEPEQPPPLLVLTRVKTPSLTRFGTHVEPIRIRVPLVHGRALAGTNVLVNLLLSGASCVEVFGFDLYARRETYSETEERYREAREKLLGIRRKSRLSTGFYQDLIGDYLFIRKLWISTGRVQPHGVLADLLEGGREEYISRLSQTMVI